MLQKIRENLDTYLGFNSDELFIDDMVRVFGGAIRDSIADMPIKDIDILCGPLSCKRLGSILKNNGYRYLPNVLSSYEIGQVYTIQGVINEPHTWIKGDSMVQLIRPVSSSIGKITTLDQVLVDKYKEQYLKEAFVNLIANVDISCCGMSWDGRTLYENYPNAILHAKEKLFTINNKATMYVDNRIIHRTGKLIERGWSEITNNLVDKRNIKILELLNNIKFEYTKEYFSIGEFNSELPVSSFFKELPF
jgi:hypothetical protein